MVYNDVAPAGVTPLSLHDALPILRMDPEQMAEPARVAVGRVADGDPVEGLGAELADDSGAALGEHRHVDRLRLLRLRSEEHTSELQSRRDLVCRLLLEKKKLCTSI